MTKFSVRLAVAAVVAMAASVASAQEVGLGQPQVGPGAAQGKFGFVGEFALEFGGDTVATVFFEDGDTQDVNAGQGGTLAIGAHYKPATLPVDLVATVGFKFVTTAASNADIGINRAVLQALVLYDPQGEVWVGAGPVLHAGTRFSGGGLTSNVDFGNSLGFTAQAGWRWIGLSYTAMKYTGGGATFDASAFGATIRWRG